MWHTWWDGWVRFLPNVRVHMLGAGGFGVPEIQDAFAGIIKILLRHIFVCALQIRLEAVREVDASPETARNYGFSRTAS